MSEDELTVRVVIDDSQFRDELIRLRRDLEDEHRIETDKVGKGGTPTDGRYEGPLDPFITVGEPAAGVSGGDSALQDRMNQMEQDIRDVRARSGVDPSESRTTPGMLLTGLAAAIENYTPASRFMMKQGERGGEDELTKEGAEMISLIEGIKDEYGVDTPLDFMSSSDASAVMYLRRLIELFKRDRISPTGDQIGSPGEQMTHLRKARMSRTRGAPGRVMHTGMEMSLQELASMVKGEDVITGREAMVPGNMFLDFSMATDETRYFGEIKTGDVGGGGVGQIRDYYDAIITDEMMKERGLSPSDPMPSPFEVGAWAVDRANAMRQRQEAGEEVSPFAKGLMAAPYFAGDVQEQVRRAMGMSIAAGPFVNYGAGGGEDDLLKIEYATIPEDAIKYINEGMDAVKRSGEQGTAEHWNQLHMQWVAKFSNSSYSKDLIRGLNTIIDREKLKDDLDNLRDEFSDELWNRIQSGNALAPRAARAEFYTKFKDFIAQQAEAQGQPITDTDIREEIMRPLVASGIIEPYPRGKIGALIRRGTSWMADQAMLSVERDEAQRIAAVRELMVQTEEGTGIPTVAEYREMVTALPQLERDLWELHADDVLHEMANPLEYATMAPEDRPEETLIQDPLRILRSQRDWTYDQIFTGVGVPMDIDPAEYMKDLDKTAKQMGFKSVGALQADIRGGVASIAADIRQKIADKDIEIGLAKRMTEIAPDFIRLVLGVPTKQVRGVTQIDPDKMKDFLKGAIGDKVNVDSYKKMSEQLAAIVNNSVIAATLGANNLSGFSIPAQQMKRFEQSFVGLEPAYGGALEYWK